MKVLLCEDVKKLGWLGDIVDVTEGYARNYLLPQGLAKVATETNVRSLAQEKTKRAEQRLHERRRLEKAAQAVNGAEAVVAAKANEQGVLFGSIAEPMIAANLRSQGFEVADEVVRLPEHIKQLGTHEVTLKFADDVTATVHVVVVPEQVEAQPEAAAPKAKPEEEEEEESSPDALRCDDPNECRPPLVGHAPIDRTASYPPLS